MHTKNSFEDYVQAGVSTLRTYGLSVRWGDDFDLFKRIINRHKERYDPAPGFNTDTQAGSGLDGLWLVAFDKNGALVHTQACRRVCVEPDMTAHLQQGASAYEPAYLKFDLDNMNVNLSPCARDIHGDAVYHGEAWLKGGPHGVRGGALLFIFSRMMIAQALNRWKARHIFGLITPNTGVKGLAARYGYTRCEQGAITFPKKPDLPNDLWLVWMTAEEARMQLRLTPDYFARMYAPVEIAEVA